MPAVQLEPAYVLHRRRYRDTSLLVDVWSRSAGRLVMVAKGAFRGKRAIAPLLQPFRPLLLGWTGRGEVQTLTAAEGAAAPHALQGRQLYCGFYLNELMVYLTGRQDPHPTLYDHYAAALSELATLDEVETVLRRFELQLLQQCGYGLDLTCEADGTTAVIPDGHYRVDPEHGVSACKLAGELASEQTLAGHVLLALAQGTPLHGPERRAARQLMRRVIDFHLNGRVLKSRELFLNR